LVSIEFSFGSLSFGAQELCRRHAVQKPSKPVHRSDTIEVLALALVLFGLLRERSFK
jgi:hypothetical protein